MCLIPHLLVFVLQNCKALGKFKIVGLACAYLDKQLLALQTLFMEDIRLLFQFIKP